MIVEYSFVTENGETHAPPWLSDSGYFQNPDDLRLIGRAQEADLQQLHAIGNVVGLTRQQLIGQAQQQFTQAMMSLDPSVPEMFNKLRRPFEDTLRVLGVKDVDAYLPTLEEAAKIMKAQSEKGPSPEQQKIQSETDLNKAKIEDTMANTAFTQKKAEDIDTDNMFEALAAKRGKLHSVQVD
jgi:hypothetical protein